MASQSFIEDGGFLETTDADSTLELHRSNLLRLHTAELVEACKLDSESRNWASEYQDYCQLVTKLIRKVSVVVTDFCGLADKPVTLEFRPDDESVLSVEPIGCTRVPLGWTKKLGNAHVYPTFDLMVQIPSKLFLGKDYLYYRYFDKRHVVMKNVAEALEGRSDEIGSVEYVWTNGSNRPPVLQLQPPPGKKKRCARFRVHLHFGMESIDWIPSLRLLPNRSNIKGTALQGQLYNHFLLYDVRHHFEDPHLQDLMDKKNCQDALLLLQVWGLQRGLWRNHDGWGKTAIALLMVYLLRNHEVNSRMTPVQLFTIVLQTWANTDWLGGCTHTREHSSYCQDHRFPSRGKKQRTILVLPVDSSCADGGSQKESKISSLYEKQTRESPISANDPPTLLDAYASNESYVLGPVFLDPTMKYNYLGGVSPNYMKLLKWSARRSLEALMNSRSAFEILFMHRAGFWQQWDQYFRLPARTQKSQEDWESSVRMFIAKIECGLGDRVNLVRILSNGNGNGNRIKGSPDTDQFQRKRVAEFKQSKQHLMLSPTGTDEIILGVSIDKKESKRAVDRGPSSELQGGVKEFLDLWGEKAELRRFKDGAIVHAVVWDDDEKASFQNHSTWNGGYVGKIIDYLAGLHHGSRELATCCPSFLSIIDGVATGRTMALGLCDPSFAHQQVIKAFERLSNFLTENSEQESAGSTQGSGLGLPLAIDAVEPLSPSLRYTELFPPLPGACLGGAVPLGKHVCGGNAFEPIRVQIRFGSSSKWPTDLTAICATKTAMLIQLANGIEKIGGKEFGLVSVCPSHVDIGFRGYCFRISVKADAEIQMLERLETPSPLANRLMNDLMERHVFPHRHHSMMNAVYTTHPSAPCVVRIARRWTASHLLSGHFSTELIELLVARLYSETDCVFLHPPATAIAGFLRLLELVAHHDWARQPLVVDPHGHISRKDHDEIHRAFERCRDDGESSGPAMYIVAPYKKNIFGTDGRKWEPSALSLEWVVLNRAVHVAKCSHECLQNCIRLFDDRDWQAIFKETPDSFKSYSALLRVGMPFVLDEGSSSTVSNLRPSKNADGTMDSSFTRSMKAWSLGPTSLQQKAYRNLMPLKATDVVISAWRPVQELVESMTKRFGDYAVFFYNEYCPEVVGVVWRPGVFDAASFSAMSSERTCPVSDKWRGDCLVFCNIGDVMREIYQFSRDIVTHVKIFDEACLAHFSRKRQISPSDEDRMLGKR